MDFQRACAARLDAGEAGEDVLRDMRARYTTLACLSTKVSLVRTLCAPCAEYARAVDATVLADAAHQARFRALAHADRPRCAPSDPEEVRAALRALPRRLAPNARALRLTTQETKACKRAGAARAVAKNRTRAAVDGRALLAHARATLAAPAAACVPELTLALMVTTGRRECELLNGASTFAEEAPYALRFRGQAKKRDAHLVLEEREERVVPCLAPARDVLCAFAALRARQRHGVLDNAAASRRYQSALSRHMAARAPWCAGTARRVHSLRGAYTCMCLRLFDWGAMADAYVAMCILGHSGLFESLVYTPFALGDDFAHEPRLGAGKLTPPPPCPEAPAPTSPSAAPPHGTPGSEPRAS